MVDERRVISWKLRGIALFLNALREDSHFGEAARMADYMARTWDLVLSCIDGGGCTPDDIVIHEREIVVLFKGVSDMLFRFDKSYSLAEAVELMRQGMRRVLPHLAMDMLRRLDEISREIDKKLFELNMAKRDVAELREMLAKIAGESQSSGS